MHQPAGEARVLARQGLRTESDGLQAAGQFETFGAAERIHGDAVNLAVHFPAQIGLAHECGFADRAVRDRRAGGHPGHLTREHAPIPASASVQIGDLIGEIVSALPHLQRRLHVLIAQHVAEREADTAAQRTSPPAAARGHVRLHHAIE